MKSVKELRQSGYKVKVLHDRKLVTNSWFGDRKPLTKGMTSVGVTVGDQIVTGSAYCSLKDQYNKKLGVRIALGRVYETIKEHGIEI